jgi:hypothetical protein
MRRAVPALLFCAALAACGLIPPDDTAHMPNNRFGGPAMSQNEAIGLSSYVLKDPTAVRGDPATAARAIAAEDWLAGQSRLTPDFAAYAPVNQGTWYVLRQQVRAAIGISPGTPSQVVVEHLLAASDALKAGDHAGAAAQLQPPAFSLGPDGTLAALGNLPQFPGWGDAYYELDHAENGVNGNCGFHGAC